LLLLVNDQKIAMNYPHIHRADHGTYIYNSQKPQVFRQRAKTVKPAKKTVAQPVAQPMTGNFTELTDSIVLRHKSGKLYIARPVN
jgi:hypothetical protein